MAYGISLVLYTVGIMTLLEGGRMIRAGSGRKQCTLYGIAAFFSFLWSFGFAILWIQKNIEMARIWRSIGMIGVFCLFFTLTELFVQWIEGAKKFKAYVRLIAGIGIFLWPFVIGAESVTFYPTWMGTTYQFSKNIYNTIYNIYCVLTGINYFIIFIYIDRNAKRKKLQVVAKRLSICCIVVMIGMIFDTLLPIFGFNALPASTFTQGIGVLMLASVLKFEQTSEITISNISEFVYYSVNTPILIYDENERFCLANAGANEFFGGHYKELINDRLCDIFALPENCMQFSENKKTEEAECLINKRFCQLEINKILDEYHDITGYIVVFGDLTEKMDFISKLQESEQRAEMANRAKSNFLARMSHEIRTPINGIVGMNEMILRESKDDKILKYAKMVNLSAHNLIELVNDILDISKIEANHVVLENAVYQLPNLLKEIAAIANVRAQSKEIAFDIQIMGHIPVSLNGDEKKLRQVMMNIVGNAIKYTKKGSVLMQVQGEYKEDKYYLKTSVKDTGIGIKEENMNTIFEAFERIDSATNQGIEGTGLGLYIVKNLVQIMEGTIQVNSVYGEGSEFIIEIPQIPVSEETFEDMSWNSDTSQVNVAQIQLQIPDKRILVVDDNEINRIVACELLAYTQADVESAGGGEECLRLVQKQRYDFILLDYIMPDMDGIRVLEELKKLPNNQSKDAIIIILTANAIQGAKEEYLAKGFDDYLSKPIDMKQVEEVLKKYC